MNAELERAWARMVLKLLAIIAWRLTHSPGFLSDRTHTDHCDTVTEASRLLRRMEQDE